MIGLWPLYRFFEYIVYFIFVFRCIFVVNYFCVKLWDWFDFSVGEVSVGGKG